MSVIIQIIALLHMILAVLSNPSVQSNPALMAKANNIANTVMQVTQAEIPQYLETGAGIASAPSASSTQEMATVQSSLESTSTRPVQVIEAAFLNFGNGFKRDSEFSPFSPPVYTGGSIQGKLGFSCSYISHIPGLPDLCDPGTQDTSTLPSIANRSLTITIQEEASSTETTVQTDSNGNFSFSLPASCSPEYQIEISNGEKFVFTADIRNNVVVCHSTSTTSGIGN